MMGSKCETIAHKIMKEFGDDISPAADIIAPDHKAVSSC